MDFLYSGCCSLFRLLSLQFPFLSEAFRQQVVVVITIMAAGEAADSVVEAQAVDSAAEAEASVAVEPADNSTKGKSLGNPAAYLE